MKDNVSLGATGCMTAGWAGVGRRSDWLPTPLWSLSSAVGVAQLPLLFLLSCAQGNPGSLVLHSRHGPVLSIHCLIHSSAV